MNEVGEKSQSVDYNETIKALAEVAYRAYMCERERQDILEKKSVNLLGFSGIMITIAVSIGAFLFGRDILRPEYVALTKVLFVSSILLISSSTIFALMVITLKKYEVMDLDTIITEENKKLSAWNTYDNMARLYKNMASEDRKVNDDKAKNLKASQALLIAGLAVLFLEALAISLGTL